MNRLGPVVTEDQSASLPASVRVRYGRLTEVSKCVHRDVQNIHHTLLPPALCVCAGGGCRRCCRSPREALMSTDLTQVCLSVDPAVDPVADPVAADRRRILRRSLWRSLGGPCGGASGGGASGGPCGGLSADPAVGPAADPAPDPSAADLRRILRRTLCGGPAADHEAADLRRTCGGTFGGPCGGRPCGWPCESGRPGPPERRTQLTSVLAT